jgi:uncharacterized protein YgiM (DUF1202 family)
MSDGLINTVLKPKEAVDFEDSPVTATPRTAHKAIAVVPSKQEQASSDFTISTGSLQVGGLTGAVIAAVFILRKLQTMWQKEGGEMSNISASKDIVDMLREEVSRMSAVNTELALKVNEFQLENVKLNSQVAQMTEQMVDSKKDNDEQLGRMRQENGELRVEIEALSQAISKLQVSVDKT